MVTDKKAGHLGPLEAPGPTARLGTDPEDGDFIYFAPRGKHRLLLQR